MWISRSLVIHYILNIRFMNLTRSERLLLTPTLNYCHPCSPKNSKFSIYCCVYSFASSSVKGLDHLTWMDDFWNVSCFLHRSRMTPPTVWWTSYLTKINAKYMPISSACINICNFFNCFDFFVGFGCSIVFTSYQCNADLTVNLCWDSIPHLGGNWT